MLKTNKKLYRAVIIAIAVIAVFLVNPAWAQPDVGLNFAANTDLQPAAEGDVRDLIVKIIKYFITFIGLIAVVMIMYSGFLWMTSNGQPEKIASAKKTLINSLIGLIVALAAFAIVTFIANLFGGSGSGGGLGGGSPRVDEGYGAIGSCSVRSVYPEPNQLDVPRNYPIVITFRDEVDPATMRDGANNILTDNIKIFHMDDLSDCMSAGPCPSQVMNAQVDTTDNFTFVITPASYLGSASEIIWYTVHINSNVLDAEGQNIFRDCSSDYLRWSFEVSNRLDLVPPQVKEGGIFPGPDDLRDTVTTSAAVQASGSITVNSRPAEFAPAAVTATLTSPAGAPWPGASASLDSHCDTGGVYRVSLDAGAPNQAFLSRSGISLGAAPTSGNQVSFSYCSLVLVMDSSDFASACASAGCAWDVSATAAVEADTIRVNSTVYVFGSGAGQIATNANNAITAGNIAARLDSHPLLEANSSGASVLLTAAAAGSAGNNILVESDSGSLSVTALAGGANSDTAYTAQDARDKARNAVIQINFNEAMNPLTISGPAQDLANYIRVKCLDIGGAPCTGPDFFACGADTCIDGRFEVASQYKTVEFLTNNLCGVNGCGEEIYCLPGNSHIEVEVNAALLTTCPSPTDCATKSPFNTCSAANHCVDAGGENLPTALIPLSAANGTADMALNSLDGNRTETAQGPVNYYNENSPAASDGDSYAWSFYINDLIDASSPAISQLTPNQGAGSVPGGDPIRIRFSKLMMNSSLKAGRISVFNGQSNFYHKGINLWGYTGSGLGYWIDAENPDTSVPPDGEPDISEAIIRHSQFREATSYRAQAGSALKDIYQNCYKPSAYDPPIGADCLADELQPNCCPAGGILAPVDGSGINAQGNCEP